MNCTSDYFTDYPVANVSRMVFRYRFSHTAMPSLSYNLTYFVVNDTYNEILSTNTTYTEDVELTAHFRCVQTRNNNQAPHVRPRPLLRPLCAYADLSLLLKTSFCQVFAGLIRMGLELHGHRPVATILHPSWHFYGVYVAAIEQSVHYGIIDMAV